MTSRKVDRRSVLGSVLGAATTLATPTMAPAATAVPAFPFADLKWGMGFEGQRRGDRGDGTFLNPILAGDHPDPSIIKDGADYYMCFSSFDAYPGVVIWRSGDLVNWTPVVASLTTNIGSVWAPELIKHNGRYFIYIPARFPNRRSIYVIWADRIEGPWSEPIDLKLASHIDPGHAVDRAGRRWLFLSSGDRVALADDGLSTVGQVEHVYDPWRPPEDWVIEGFAPEGPKVMRHGEYYYLITAVGGTAGPPTGHMVIAARARDLAGPWEDHPANPLVRTTTAAEKWWSRGHATLVEGPAGDWWMVYHGYENGFWTLGRQTLLDPIEWTKDGWFRAKGGDLSRPIRKPRGGRSGPHGAPLSDDFTTDKYGVQWSFYDPGENEKARLSRAGGVLSVKAKGATPADASPLTFHAGDLAYQMEVDVEIDEGAEAGVVLFYNRRMYCGLSFNKDRLVQYRTTIQRNNRRPEGAPTPMRRLRLRVTNDRHIVTFHYALENGPWRKFDTQMEVSGYHHNTAYDFLSLKPGIFVSGSGQARFRNLNYRALDTKGGDHGV